jgi:trypsin-like peptidase
MSEDKQQQGEHPGQTIAQQLLYSTVRLEVVAPSTAVGTAFLFSHKLEGSKNFLVLVTNKHVVSGATEVHLTFTERDEDKPRVGMGVSIPISNFDKLWFGHPNEDVDIVIIPFLPLLQLAEKDGKLLYFRAIGSDLIPTNEQLDSVVDYIEDVIFIGYPSGIFDEKSLIPVTRRGTTATPLQMDFRGLPVFLLDASVFPGSSGSPVVLLKEGGYLNRREKAYVMGGRLFLFLGVVAAAHFRQDEGRLEWVKQEAGPRVVTREMIDLGVVFKARTIVETIDAFLRSQSSR